MGKSIAELRAKGRAEGMAEGNFPGSEATGWVCGNNKMWYCYVSAISQSTLYVHDSVHTQYGLAFDESELTKVEGCYKYESGSSTTLIFHMDGDSDYAIKINLGPVDADMEITTALSHSVSESLLRLDEEEYSYGLFKNTGDNDTLTYTVAADVTKVYDTKGKDIISMTGATALTEIDLSKGSGNDIVIVNEELWKCDLNNVDKYSITLNACDTVKIGNIASCTSATHQVAAINSETISNAISNTDGTGLFFFTLQNTTTSETQKYLVYDKDNKKALNAGDIVIKIVGANYIGSVNNGYIEFN